ncbi:MAG: C25 family cysteine peptidase [Candidatus Lokiarchaeota archaeon]
MKNNKSIIQMIFIISILFPLIFSLGNWNTIKSNSTIDNKLLNSQDSQFGYLIITTEEFSNSLAPLRIWKSQKGLDAVIITTDEIDQEYSGVDLQEKIKNCIIDYYQNHDLKWVLLAGDNEDVPSRYVWAQENYPYDGNVVSCDSYYADLDNNWNLNHDDKYGYIGDSYDFHAEVYVGRLSANNKAEMAKLVERILNYEMDPDIGAWMNTAIFAGAFICFEEDWNSDGVPDLLEADRNQYGNFLASRLPKNWTYNTLGESEGLKASDYKFNLSLTGFNLRSLIKNGVSVGSIYGHGNPGAIKRMIWTTDYDGDGLFDWDGSPYEGGSPIDIASYPELLSTDMDKISPNNDHLGCYYLMGCSNGQFDLPEDCLAEYFLKDGAIVSIAGSYLVWGEDNWTVREGGGWYSEGLCARFYENLFQCKRPGQALALAKEDYWNDRIASGVSAVEPGWENKTLKQFNLFGDPEIPIWLGIPKKLNCSFVNQSSSTLVRLTVDNDPVENVTVTVMIDTHLAFLGKTNGTGYLEIPYTYDQLLNYDLVATKMGYVPYLSMQDKIPIPNNGPSIPSFNLIIIVLISFLSITSLILKIRDKYF